ncbi:MAG: beta-lactamase family protein [Bacteroidia bacterium]|nr:beta-lactamase family protein [Bacteroidia bacterium]
MKNRSTKLVFFLVIGLQVVMQSQDTYFPDRGIWEEQSPQSQDVNAELLNIALAYADTSEYVESRDLRVAILKGFRREPFHQLLGPTKKRGGPAGLIIKNGYVIAKWGDLDRVDMTFSVTKSYLSTVAGLAVDHNLIQSVNEPVRKYVWDGKFDGEHNAKISWQDLLNQSSDWSGQLWGGNDWADRPPREGGLDDWKFRDLDVPGEVYEYNDVRVNLLAYSLLQVWREPLPKVLRKYIMDPISASTTWRWYGYENSYTNIDGVMVQSVSGGGHSGGGIFINTWDHARFGYLFLRNGKWKNQQLISTNWIREATTSSLSNPSYGYMWWLNKGNRKNDNLPESNFYASGFGGNYVIIDRQNDMVIVARWLSPPRLNTFLEKVYAALEE